MTTTPTPTPDTISVINGPAVVVGAPTEPAPDTCLNLGNGVGQTARSLMPCDLATGQIIWTSATDPAPVALVAIPRALPRTGSDVQLGGAGLFVLLGVVACRVARRPRHAVAR